MLKRILQVKANTPNDLIYVELNRCDIVSKVKSRQCKFYHQFKELNEDEATARKVLDMCSHLEVINYYESLSRHDSRYCKRADEIKDLRISINIQF